VSSTMNIANPYLKSSSQSHMCPVQLTAVLLDLHKVIYFPPSGMHTHGFKTIKIRQMYSLKPQAYDIRHSLGSGMYRI